MSINGTINSVNESKITMKLVRIFLFLILILTTSIIISGASSAVSLTDNTTTPQVTAVDPADGTTNVAANKTIEVTFNKNIKEGTNWIELKDITGTVIDFNTSINDNILTIDPTSDLTESRYKLSLHTGCVTDLEGNLSASKSIYFSVGTSPIIISSDPADKALNVVTNKTITVKFSETIKRGNFWIELMSNGTSIDINKTINGNVLTITSLTPLSPNTKYYLTLHTGSITDLAVNPFKLKTISFTSIYIMDSSVGGDVLENPEIDQYIPKTSFSMEIFNMVKQGSVVLKFGNGDGPKLLISAGIHGNEPEANIAIMKYLEYIKDESFNGTLYVIPFDIPQSTALNSRLYDGTDPNRVANVSGTPGWNIVKFAKDNGIDYLLDVHSGSEVGKYGYIFLNSIPTTEEVSWASYVKSITNCYSRSNGAESLGILRYYAHTQGINSITFEVERDSIPTSVAAETEFQMIKAATQKLGFEIDPPTIISSIPTNGARNVASIRTITVTFSEAIKEGTNWIELVNSTINAITFTTSIDGNVLTINTTTDLTEDRYKLMLHTGCVTDLAGNLLAGKSISFSVGTSPTINNTSPVDNTTNVKTNKTITVTFSESIRKSRKFWIELVDNTGTAIDYTSYITGGNILVISPVNDLVANTTYKLKLHTGCVTDLAGNLLAGQSFSFTTQPI